ncbi:hypothetical protein FPOAC1_005874 [Fusarium poae]|uniref:hypothetical protein n=1 Tax=Fusarium poae TaxID=36050 RepID=UPI001CEA3746|nr:hypothetical protein FPOAC1_005874 [Fusarium poae]KAG8672598.1 hypothetical protein FPOAC1_005874 [Fusarium poae]
MHLSIKIPLPSLKRWPCITGENAHNSAQITTIALSHEEDAFEEIANISDEVESLHESDDEVPYPESPITYNDGPYFDAEDYFYHNDGKYFEKALRPEKKPKPPQPKRDAYLLNELHIAMHGAKDPEVIKMENYVNQINNQPDAPLQPKKP